MQQERQEVGGPVAAEDRPIQREIHMIIGGSSGLAKLSKVKKAKLEDAIIFTEQDAEGVLTSHNDAVVVIVNIVDYNIHRIFIDNGSLVDVLYYFIFSQMRFTPD